jgi:hypothetical protein
MFVTCCMCFEKITRGEYCVPVKCLVRNGTRAHQMCHTCWWNPTIGFAREDTSHKCPGCIRQLPLTAHVSDKTVVDLTDK